MPSLRNPRKESRAPNEFERCCLASPPECADITYVFMVVYMDGLICFSVMFLRYANDEKEK